MDDMSCFSASLGEILFEFAGAILCGLLSTFTASSLMCTLALRVNGAGADMEKRQREERNDGKDEDD